MPISETKRIYLDNAATTPLCEAAAAAMAPYMQPGCTAPFGNANSLHSVGREAFSALEDARFRVARALDAHRPDEIIFTAGATESDNSAIIGMALGAREKARLAGKHGPFNVVSSRIEHEAVLETSHMLRLLGFEFRFAENDGKGYVSPEALERVVDENTLVVSIMAANNEIGTIEPTELLCRKAHEAGALFHVDAVQALGKIPISLKNLGVDAASFSAHKVGGPKGVGVLYLAAKAPYMAYLAGGGQEGSRRSGTQNVAGIVGAAAAIEAAVSEQQAYANRVLPWRDALYARMSDIKKVTPSVPVEPGSTEFLPNIVNVCVRGVESQTLILQLDRRGICVSGGSACASGSLDPSHVLSAIGVERSLAQGELRVSIGPHNTAEDIEEFFEAFQEAIV